MTFLSKLNDTSPLASDPLTLLMRLAVATGGKVTIEAIPGEHGQRWWRVQAGELEFITRSHLPPGHPMEREMEWSNILANLVALDVKAREMLEPRP